MLLTGASVVTLANDSSASCCCVNIISRNELRLSELLKEMLHGLLVEILGQPVSAELLMYFYIPWRKLTFVIAAKWLRL